MPKPSKIEFYKLEEDVIDFLFDKRYTCRQVAEKLNERGYNISEQNVARFKRYVMDSVPEFLEQSEEYRKKLAKRILDINENLMDLVDECKSKIKEYRSGKNWKAHVSYLNSFISTLSMMIKRMENLTKKEINVKQMNVLQINQLVQGELGRLFKEGKIEPISGDMKLFKKKMVSYEDNS